MKFKRGDYFRYHYPRNEIIIGRITHIVKDRNMYYYICLYSNVNWEHIGIKSCFSEESKMETESIKIDVKDVFMEVL
jgi:hypothetical protein